MRWIGMSVRRAVRGIAGLCGNGGVGAVHGGVWIRQSPEGGHGLAWTVMGEAMVSGPASAPLVQDLVLLAQTGTAAAG
jgi:hypothetical protein